MREIRSPQCQIMSSTGFRAHFVQNAALDFPQSLYTIKLACELAVGRNKTNSYGADGIYTAKTGSR